jgi:hypothetical protein
MSKMWSLFLKVEMYSTEFQDIFIPDGIGDHIFVEAVSEKHLRGPFAPFVGACIFFKDRCAREPEHLGILEKHLDVGMGLSKLTPVAFIKDEDDALVFEVSHLFHIVSFVDCRGKFLDGRNDQLVVSRELLDKLVGVVGSVYAALAETVEFLGGLGIEVFPVHHKDHFVYLWQVGENLGSLEGSECLARTCGVPDVAIFGGGLHTLHDGF